MSTSAFDHHSWHQTFDALRADRDTLARVVASYVLEGNWDMAAEAGRQYAELRQAIKNHMELLPSRDADKPAD